ncbi:nucleoside triphosphate pyrophosphohydrolase [soil metagenome]
MSTAPVGRVTVVGLGPAGPELLTVAALAAIERSDHRFLRTTRHPAAPAVAVAASFDRTYDDAATFDEVYRRIVDALVEAAHRHGEVLYAVPGSPLVAERTVELLRADGRVALDVQPALSFADLAWVRLGVDPLAAGVRLVDGRRFATEAAGERGPLLVAQCDSRAVLSDIKLAVEGEPPPSVTVLQRLGLPDEAVTTIAWEELDRVVEPDHLTSVYVPELGAQVAMEVTRFVELVATLRRECPWDREQTHQSLTHHLLEETYEVLEAIGTLSADGAGYDHLEEELGDLLCQVVFHTTLAAEQGAFTLADVARGIHDKLVYRHPHVFADVAVAGRDDVARNWEDLKAAEKGRASIFDGIPAELPALAYAAKVLRKAASLGVEPASPAAEAAPVEDAEALGQALLGLVASARHHDLDPEAALRAAAARVRAEAIAREGNSSRQG